MKRTCVICGRDVPEDEASDVPLTPSERLIGDALGDDYKRCLCGPCRIRMAAYVRSSEFSDGTLAGVLEEYLEIAGEDGELDPPAGGTTGRLRLDQLEAEITAAVRRVGAPVVLYRPDPDGSDSWWVWWAQDDDIAHINYDASDFLRNLHFLETEGRPRPVVALDYAPDGSL